MKLRTKCQKTKTSAEDGVVTEILQELDGDILENDALLFKDPLLNFMDSSWNAWEHHMVSLIPKPNKNAFTPERSVAGISHVVHQTSGSSLC